MPKAICTVRSFVSKKWSRLFEQLSPIYKWTPGGLREVQSCPRRRSALATDRPPRWTTRGAPPISFYAACLRFGDRLRYACCGVAPLRRECARCVLNHSRYRPMSARAALTLS